MVPCPCFQYSQTVEAAAKISAMLKAFYAANVVFLTLLGSCRTPSHAPDAALFPKESVDFNRGFDAGFKEGFKEGVLFFNRE